MNTVLVSGGRTSESALRSALELEDMGVSVPTLAGPPAVAIESASGILGEGLENAARTAAEKLGLQPVPVFTYLANTIRKGDRQIPYSLITATDLALLPARAAGFSQRSRGPPPLALARRLRASLRPQAPSEPPI